MLLLALLITAIVACGCGDSSGGVIRPLPRTGGPAVQHHHGGGASTTPTSNQPPAQGK